DLAIDNCKTLYNDYWSKGITVFKPDPLVAIEELEKHKQIVIEEEVELLVEQHLEKANRAKTVKSKISNADKALDELFKLKKKYNYENNGLESNTNEYKNKAQLDQHITNAEKNEFKGNIKKAIDYYQEALFFLKKDDIPDVEQETIIKD